MSAGKQVNRILVMEPTSTSWMLHSPIRQKSIGSAPREIDDLKDRFHKLLEKLERNQIEYDLGCESIIKSHGQIEGNKFVVGSRKYDLLMLPPMFENLMDSTYKLMMDYLANGGKIISMSGIPERLDGNRSKTMSDNLGKYADQWIMVDEIDENIINQYLRARDFKAHKPESWKGNVFHHRRILKDGHLYFFANFHKEEIANVSFSGRGKSVLEFNPHTGEYHVLNIQPKDGFVSLNFNLYPSGSKLVLLADDVVAGERAKQSLKLTEEVLETSPSIVKRLQPNTLTLDYCDLTIDGKTYKDIYFYNAADTIFKTYLKEIYGFNYNPWSIAVQYRTRILDKNEFEEGSGFAVSYNFQLEQDFDPTSLKVAVEWPQFYQLTINDTAIEPEPDTWWLDKSFGVFNLSDLVREGNNTLTLIAKTMDVLAEVEPAYLVGDFSVRSSDKGFILGQADALEIGSWKSQHMPFYSHDVSYSKTFNGSAGKSIAIQLGDWEGTVASVNVNGKQAGLIAWPPYQINISDFVEEGKNQVHVIVTGSLKNQLGPHHNNPRRGFVTPWSFFFAPDHLPQGNSYDHLDYGLFEDFKIISF